MAMRRNHQRLYLRSGGALMIELTSEHVKAFWAYMKQEFDSSVEEKNDILVMQIAAALLDTLHIQNKDLFMKNFVTTLWKTIYIPFIVGVEDDRWKFWNQIRVCVHEHQHIIQGMREGWPVFSTRYVTSSSYRAGYEAEAFGCDLEMEYYRTGQILDVAQRVSILKDYGCKVADIEQAQQMLSIRAEVVKQGVIENQATMKAVAWLDANIPGLKFVG
jgi:hypothetical protein